MGDGKEELVPYNALLAEIKTSLGYIARDVDKIDQRVRQQLSEFAAENRYAINKLGETVAAHAQRDDDRFDDADRKIGEVHSRINETNASLNNAATSIVKDVNQKNATLVWRVGTIFGGLVLGGAMIGWGLSVYTSDNKIVNRERSGVEEILELLRRQHPRESEK